MTDAPKWFKPVAIVALLWNLLGCFAYLSNVMATPEAVAAMTEAEQAMHHAFPVWGVAGMAIAVWAGALGSLGLVLRKVWAVGILAVSLAGVVLQDVGLYQALRAAPSGGGAGIVMQGLVLVIAIALVVLARRARAEGWIG